MDLHNSNEGSIEVVCLRLFGVEDLHRVCSSGDGEDRLGEREGREEEGEDGGQGVRERKAGERERGGEKGGERGGEGRGRIAVERRRKRGKNGREVCIREIIIERARVCKITTQGKDKGRHQNRERQH